MPVRSEIAGVVETIEKHAGESVAAGDEIVILSSMKMEIPVVAPRAGRIERIAVALGDVVAEKQILFTLED